MSKEKKIKAAITVISIAAIAVILNFVAKTRFDVQNEMRRGFVDYNAGEYNKAIGHFNRAFELDSRNAEALLYLGLSKIAKNDYSSAIIDLNAAVALDEAYADAYYIRALSYFETENWELAIADASKAITYIEYKPLEFNEFEAYILRGVSKYELNDFGGALEDLDMALRLNDNFDYGYFCRGLVKISLKDHNSAIDDFNTAISKNADFTEAYFARGEAKEELGKFMEAAIDYENVLRTDPQIDNSQQLREFIFTHLGRNSKY